MKKPSFNIFVFLVLTTFFAFIGIKEAKAIDFVNASCYYVKTADYITYTSSGTVAPFKATSVAVQKDAQQHSGNEDQGTVITGIAMFNGDKVGIDWTTVQNGNSSAINGCAPYMVLAFGEQRNGTILSESQASLAYSKNDAYNIYSKYQTDKFKLISTYGPDYLPRWEYFLADPDQNKDQFDILEILDLSVTKTTPELESYETQMCAYHNQIKQDLTDISHASAAGQGYSSTETALNNIVNQAKTYYYYVNSATNFPDKASYIRSDMRVETLCNDTLKEEYVDAASFAGYLKDAKAGTFHVAEDATSEYESAVKPIDDQLNANGCGSEKTASSSKICSNLFDQKTELQKNYAKETRDLNLSDGLAKELTKKTGVIVTKSEHLTCDDFKEEGSSDNIFSEIFSVIKIIAPILVIFLGIGDFIKAFASGKDDAMKKAASTFGKRLAAAVLLFFIPFILQILLQWAFDSGLFNTTTLTEPPSVCV